MKIRSPRRVTYFCVNISVISVISVITEPMPIAPITLIALISLIPPILHYAVTPLQYYKGCSCCNGVTLFKPKIPTYQIPREVSLPGG